MRVLTRGMAAWRGVHNVLALARVILEWTDGFDASCARQHV